MRTIPYSCGALLWFLCSSPASAQYAKPTLTFSQPSASGISSFKILQITDIHTGQIYNNKDSQTYQLLQNAIGTERPDLIIVSGDMLSDEQIQSNPYQYINRLAQVLQQFNIPWAVILGNHDVTYYYNTAANARSESQATATNDRIRIAQTDMQYPLSLTQIGPSNVFGVSNYWLNVNHPQNNGVAARILLLDTGGGTLQEKIDTTQVDWFLQTNNPSLPTVVFHHIPIAAMSYSSSKCSGYSMDGRIDPIPTDSGMSNAFADAGNVHLVAVGHNHGNDFCCPMHNYHFCFGRQSGFGGAYGVTEKGIRVYQLNYNNNDGSLKWLSWVRTQTGRVIDYYAPNY